MNQAIQIDRDAAWICHCALMHQATIVLAQIRDNNRFPTRGMHELKIRTLRNACRAVRSLGVSTPASFIKAARAAGGVR